MTVKDDTTMVTATAVNAAVAANASRYPVYDEFVIEADDGEGALHYLTVRECRDCGVVVGNKEKHDAYHELLSEICFREARR